MATAPSTSSPPTDGAAPEIPTKSGPPGADPPWRSGGGDDGGGGRGRPGPHRALPLVTALLGAVLLGVGIGYSAFRVTAIDTALIAIALAGMVAAAAGLLAVLRFEWFLIGLFGIRSSLDAFSGTALGGLDPSAALGAMLVLLGVTWLVIQWQTGHWRRPSAPTKALYLLAGAGFLSVIGATHRFVALESAVSVLAGAVMFGVLEQVLGRRPALVRPLLLALYLSLVVPAVVAFAQASGGGVGADNNTGLSRIMGTFAHPNPFASYLVLLLLLGVGMFLVSTGWFRIASAAVIVVAGPLIIITYTRVAWAAAVVGLAYLGFRHSRAILAALGLGLVVVVLAVPSVVTRLSDLTAEPKYEGVPANSLAWRIQYWEELLPLANINPVTGIGLDTVKETTIDGLRPHNVFVQTYVETGALGLVALGLVLVSFWRLLRERRRRAVTSEGRMLASVAVAAALALFVQMFTENLTTSTIVWWYAAAVLTFGLPPQVHPGVARPGRPVPVPG